MKDAPHDKIEFDIEKRMKLIQYIDSIALKIGRAFIQNPQEGGWAVFNEHKKELIKAKVELEDMTNDFSNQLCLNIMESQLKSGDEKQINLLEKVLKE